LRIERSKFLIRSGKIGLKEIASQLGFADQGHFTRLFKRETGLTPKLYANQSSSKPNHMIY
jgi:AraC family transcriptional regulator